ncbi:MAG: hypothetical protein ACLQL2_04060 [Methylovirgula sp.]
MAGKALIYSRADVAGDLTADAIALIESELLDMTALCGLGFARRDAFADGSADDGNRKKCRAGNQSKEQNDFTHNALAACTGECRDYAEHGNGISAMSHLAP